MAVDSSRREAVWILVRIGVEAPIFALQEHLSKVVVGRSSGCDLYCSGETVSRKHFELQRVESNHDRHISWNICDTSNDSIGTFVNGSRIPKGRPVRLNDQDVIALGDHTQDAVKDKRPLFRYLVVAPKGLFPDPDSDDNAKA